MEAAALWIIQNLGEVGFLGAVVIVAILVIRGDLQLGREAKAGIEALKLLPEINEKLAQSRIDAARQEIRDSFGAQEQDRLKRDCDDVKARLAQCLTNLDTRVRDHPPRTEWKRRTGP